VLEDPILIVFAGIGAWFIGCESRLAVDGMAPGGCILGAPLSPVTLFAHLLIVRGCLRVEWRDIACRAVASSIAAIGTMILTFEFWRGHSPMLFR
jgi:hypothetical protein